MFDLISFNFYAMEISFQGDSVFLYQISRISKHLISIGTTRKCGAYESENCSKRGSWITFYFLNINPSAFIYIHWENQIDLYTGLDPELFLTHCSVFFPNKLISNPNSIPNYGRCCRDKAGRHPAFHLRPTISFIFLLERCISTKSPCLSILYTTFFVLMSDLLKRIIQR